MPISVPESASRKNYFVLFTCILLGIIFFAYVFARAWTLSITHDEAQTCNVVVNHPVMEIISYNTSTQGYPNNHILNSLLIKFFTWVMGTSVFITRLPNVLAYFFYLIFSYLICKKLNYGPLIIAGFILLNINPYVLEFFALARGYGLANLFLIGAIYYLI